MWTLATIGSFVVNAGALERTLRPLVEWLSGNQQPGNITTTRSLSGNTLLKCLREASAGSAIEAGVTQVLDEHKADRCMGMRHSLIHGSVDVSQPPNIMINRSPTSRSTGDSLQFGTRQEVAEYAGHLASMVVKLDALLPELHRRVKQNLPAGVGGITRDDAIAMGLDPDIPFEEQRERYRAHFRATHETTEEPDDAH